MKKVALLLITAIAMLGCSQEEFNEPQDLNETQIIVNQEDLEEICIDNNTGLRTSFATNNEAVGWSWSPNDKIGLVKERIDGSNFNTTNNKIKEFTYAGGSSINAKFTGTDLDIGTGSDGNGNYVAYYPTKVTIDNNAESITFNLPMQTQEENLENTYSHYSKSGFMYTRESALVTKKTECSGFTFRHAFSIFRFELEFTGDESVLLQEIKLQATTNPIFATSVTLSYNRNEADTTKATFGNFENSISLSTGTGEGTLLTHGTTYHGLLFVGISDPSATTPFSVTESIDVIVYTDKGSKKIFTIGPRPFVPNKIYKLSKSFNNEIDKAAEQPEVWNGEWAFPTKSGMDIRIDSPKELAWVAGVSNGTITGSNTLDVPQNFKDYTITLSKNINLGSISWNPINTGTTSFQGTFIGNGKIITGLKIDGGSTNQRGFFAAIGANGSISNLTIESPVILGRDTIGAFVGMNRGTISGCKLTGGTISGGNYVGGIAGINDHSNKGVISSECTVTGATITGTGVAVGGIVGGISASGGKVSDCTVTDATIRSDGNCAGGIIGRIDASSPASCTSCTVGGTTTIFAYNNAGGIIGRNAGPNLSTSISGWIVNDITLDDIFLTGGSNKGLYIGSDRNNGSVNP